MTLKDGFSQAWDWAADLAVRTKVEIGVGVLAGSLAFGIGSHNQQINKSQFQPASFSEYEQLEDAASAGGPKMNHLTWFYAGNNDFLNKIFEAYNADNIIEAPLNALPNTKRKLFAYNLKNATGPNDGKFRRNITDLAKILPEHANGALTELNDLRNAAALKANIDAVAGPVWDYYFKENGHLEPQTECTTDEDGDMSCSTSLEYECDSYDYRWTYNAAQGKLLFDAMANARSNVPQIDHVKILTPTKTNLENEFAIRNAFVRENKREPTQVEMLSMVHLYKTGSQYELHIDKARSIWAQIAGPQTDQWANMHKTAHTVTKRTNCFPAGAPPEYDFVKHLRTTLDNYSTNEQIITNSISSSIENNSRLDRMIDAYIQKEFPNAGGYQDAEFSRWPSEKLENTIINTARENYRQNYPKGLPTTEYNGYAVFLMTLLGGALGAGAGFGVDMTVDKFAQTRRD